MHLNINKGGTLKTLSLIKNGDQSFEKKFLSRHALRVGAMLDLKELKPKYITNESGKKTAVILAIEKFQELLEDIEDLAAVAERREESTISHEELLAELKKDGLL